MCVEIISILRAHQRDKSVLMANSNDTATSTQMLRIQLVDLILFLLDRPKVVHNFLYQLPQRSSEHQSCYFAGTDMGAAHTLTRRMFWSETFQERTVEGRRMTMSHRYSIVDAESAGRFSTREKGVRVADEYWSNKWKK